MISFLPPLHRDEPDKNAVFYLVYDKLEAENNQDALMEFRRVVLELLMTAFAAREDLSVIDSLGHMAGFFQVLKSKNMAEQLRAQLIGFMTTRLKTNTTYIDITQMMNLPPEEMHYACRALDLWLTVTPTYPEDRDAPFYTNFINLFEYNINNFIYNSEVAYHLLLLSFRVIIKIHPHYTGYIALKKMCRIVEKAEKATNDNMYRHGWFGFCRELKLRFENKDNLNWKSEFVEGLSLTAVLKYGYNDEDNFMEQSLKRMDINNEFNNN